MTAVENERLAIVETKQDASAAAIALLSTKFDSLDLKLDTVLVFVTQQRMRDAAAANRNMFYRWLLPTLSGLAGAAVALAGFMLMLGRV